MGSLFELCKRHNDNESQVFDLFFDSYKSLKREISEIEDLIFENQDKLYKSGACNVEYKLKTNFEDLRYKYTEMDELLGDCFCLIWEKGESDKQERLDFPV